MATQLGPEGIESLLADMDRRLRMLESTSRAGFSLTRNAQTDTAALAGTFGTWEYSTAGATFVDDTAVSQAGYPQLTMRTGVLVKIDFGGRLEGLANAAGYRSAAGTLGVQVDGLDAQPSAGVTYQLNAAVYDVPQSHSYVYRLTPGVHTFKLGVLWENTIPAAPSLPRLSDAFIIISPISVV